jgi:hypothetical protein
MPQRAKTRIVGTIAAIPLSILWFGTATSQSTVSNDQVQSADVYSDGVLNVVTNDSDTTTASVATGNSLIGSVVTGGLNVQSSQTVTANVIASTDTTIGQTPGDAYVSTTAATGNSGASVITSSYTLTGNFLQTTAGPTVDAESLTAADGAYTADASQSVQAVANGQQLGATDSSVVASVTQSNTSPAVEANGAADFNYITDQGVFAATAAGNDVTASASGNVTQNLTVNQTNAGALTQAQMFTQMNMGQTTSTSAVATGNDIDATNTQGALYVTDGQSNQSQVVANAVGTVDSYGSATVTAEGVGNTVTAANVGPTVGLNNTQVSTGGVQANANFTGNDGYDLAASSSATGNSATGFACSSCGGTMNVWNSQSNAGGVAAETQVTQTGAGRSTASVATATGNTATFYVSTPH